MTPKRILVLNGHPGQSSLSKSLTAAYVAAALSKGHDVRKHDLSEMEFDLDYGDGGYTDYKPLEPDLDRFLTDLEWAEHIVVSTPLWWGAFPAKLKGLIDRTFLPGRTFDTRNPTLIGFPSPMMKGKTARVLLTADTPAIFMRLMYSNAVKKFMSRQIFGFIGIKPTKFTQFTPASHPGEKRVKKWLATAERLGARAA